VLPTHPRPLHDPALHFVRPTWVRVDTLNNWDSFPSDHASLLFALAMAIWVVRPRVGVAAFIWALLLCVGRVYCGFHFPSDIVGGIGLGVLVVCIAQLAFIRKLCCGVIRCASKWTPSVCAIAFIAAYLTATMFDDIRSVGKGITKLAPFYTHSAAITDGGYPSAGVTAACRP